MTKMTQSARKLAAAMFQPRYEQVFGGLERISAHTILHSLKANVEEYCGEIDSDITVRGKGNFLWIPGQGSFKTFTGNIKIDLNLGQTMQFIEENFDPSIGYDETGSHWYNQKGSSRDSHGHEYRIGTAWNYLIQISGKRESHLLRLNMINTGRPNYCNHSCFTIANTVYGEFERFERRRLPLEAAIAFTMSGRIRSGIIEGVFEDI